MPIRTAFLALALAASASTLAAGEIAPRDGWVVQPVDKPYAELVEAVKAATVQNGMGVVTEAGPTEAAAQRGVTIPGNRVIGVFNNDFAVRVLEVSTAAMIEAPVRFYVTEFGRRHRHAVLQDPELRLRALHGRRRRGAGRAGGGPRRALRRHRRRGQPIGRIGINRRRLVSPCPSVRRYVRCPNPTRSSHSPMRGLAPARRRGILARLSQLETR